MRTMLPLLAALAVGCNDGSGLRDSGLASHSGLTSDSAAPQMCGEDPPSFMQVGLIEGGPNVVIGLVLEDPDRALHSYVIDVWFDSEVDGAVDTTVQPYSHILSENMEGQEPVGEPCDIGGGFPISLIYDPDEREELVRGAPIEMALRVIDADGWASEVVLIDGCVPEDDGAWTCQGTTTP